MQLECAADLICLLLRHAGNAGNAVMKAAYCFAAHDFTMRQVFSVLV